MTAAEWADFYREVNVNQVAASAVAEAEADSIHSLARVSRIDGDELNAALVRSLSTLRDQASISADEMAYTSRAFQHLITEDDDGDLYGDGEDGFMDSADEILDEIEMADGTPVNRPARHNYTYQSESMRGRTYSGTTAFNINYESDSQAIWERLQEDAVRRGRVVRSSRPPRYYPSPRPPSIPVRPGALHAFDPDTEVKVYEQTEDEVVEIETDIRPEWDYPRPVMRPRFTTSEDIW